jgi:hypothetical protein
MKCNFLAGLGVVYGGSTREITMRRRTIRHYWQLVSEIPHDVCNFVEYHRRRKQNDPLGFIAVGRDDGVPVGPPVMVEHGTMYDMKEWAIRGALTSAVLLDGHKVNAYYVINSSLLSSTQMRTTVQPRWVEEAELAAEYAPA